MTISALFTGELDHAAEPFPRKHQLIPEADTLHCVEVVEPKFVLLMVSKQLAPHFLQVMEHAMELLLAPGPGLDGLELERVLPVAWDLMHHAEVKEILLHILLNWTLNLGNK